MSITLASRTGLGSETYGTKRFLLDTPDDLPNLGLNYTKGSRAFVISTSDEYMLDGTPKWVKIKTGGSSSGGDTPDPDPDKTYIYDGGEIG